MLNEYFYNQTLYKCVSVFGTVFNNIRVKHSNKPEYPVPLSYAPIQKFLARVREDQNLEDEQKNMKLPRMGFSIESLDYDDSIQLNKLNQKIFNNSDSQISKEALWQSVPYNISFSLNIMTKTESDCYQILEQILPSFVPEYTVTVKDFDGNGNNIDVPIILNGISPEREYEGSFLEYDVVRYSLDFTMRIRFFGKVQTKPLILNSTVSFIDQNFGDDLGKEAAASCLTDTYLLKENVFGKKEKQYLDNQFKDSVDLLFDTPLPKFFLPNNWPAPSGIRVLNSNENWVFDGGSKQNSLAKWNKTPIKIENIDYISYEYNTTLSEEKTFRIEFL